MHMNVFRSTSGGFLFIATFLITIYLQMYIYINKIFRNELSRCVEKNSGAECLSSRFFLGLIAIVALSLLLSYSTLAIRRGRFVLATIPIMITVFFWIWVFISIG